MKANFKLFLQLINQADIILFDVLNASNAKEAEAQFLSSTERIPHFEYTGSNNLSTQELESKLKILTDLEPQLATTEHLEDYERELLQLCLEENRLKLQCALAAAAYRSSTEHNQRISAGAEFLRCNVQLYGDAENDDLGIDWELCKAMLKWYMQRIPKQYNYSVDAKMYQDLVQQLQEQGVDWENADLSAIYTPKPETIRRFGELVEEHFANIFQHIPEQNEFTAQEVCDLVNGIIQTEFAGQTTFKAVLDEKRTVLSVDQLERIIYIPLHRAKGSYAYSVVKAIVIGHEFCTHAYRGIPYEHTGLTPLYQGMPGSDELDEGFATAVQQALSDGYEPAGFAHCINIGLTNFVLDSDYRWLYRVYLALEFLSHSTAGETVEARGQRLAETRTLAFTRIRRATRGTNDLPNPKDLTYYRGNVRAWQFIEEGLERNPEQLMRDIFESGKTDLTKPKHRQVLQKLKG